MIKNDIINKWQNDNDQAYLLSVFWSYGPNYTIIIIGLTILFKFSK